MTDTPEQLAQRMKALRILDEVGSDNPLGREVAELITSQVAEIRTLRNAAILADERAEATEAENKRLRKALAAALPRLAHKFECHSVRPTTEWAEHGSVSFENCSCEIKAVRAALSNHGEQEARQPAVDDEGRFDANLEGFLDSYDAAIDILKHGEQEKRPDLQTLLARSVAAYNAMTPEQRAVHDEAQRQSWARGMAPCEHGVADWETCPDCRGAKK
jgi:hypothetical protein